MDYPIKFSIGNSDFPEEQTTPMRALIQDINRLTNTVTVYSPNHGATASLILTAIPTTLKRFDDLLIDFPKREILMGINMGSPFIAISQTYSDLEKFFALTNASLSNYMTFSATIVSVFNGRVRLRPDIVADPHFGIDITPNVNLTTWRSGRAVHVRVSMCEGYGVIKLDATEPQSLQKKAEFA